jgi:MoxR-like ATPase
MLDVHGGGASVEKLEPVADAATVTGLIDAVKDVHAAPALKRYVVDLVRATREHPDVELGASPRASLALLRAARALAAVHGRDYAIPDDVKQLVPPVLSHRLILAPEAQMADRSATDVLADLLEKTPMPTPEQASA